MARRRGWCALPRKRAAVGPSKRAAARAAFATAFAEAFINPVPGHRADLVQASAGRFRRLVLNRGGFDEPMVDGFGEVLMAAMPELLERPPRTRDKHGKRLPPSRIRRDLEAFHRRRLDFMAGFGRVAVYLVSLAEWKPGASRGFLYWAGEPRPPSAEQIATACNVAPRTLTRILRALAILGWLPFTNRNLDATKRRSKGPWWRRLDLDKIATSFDADYRQRWEAWQGKPITRRTYTGRNKVWSHPEDRRVENAVRAVGSAASVPPAPAPSPAPKSTPDDRQALLDAIHAEHPEWSGAQIVAEAQRRRRATGPPTS